MRLVINALIALGLLGVCAAPSVAAPKKATHPQVKRDPLRDAAAAIMLNTVDPKSNLHDACRRADFKLLALGLEGIQSKINQPKGEFETAAEHQEHTAALEEALNRSGPVIVCQPLNDNEDAPFEYNAESQLFHGTIAAHQNVWRDSKPLGSYIGRTAMNVHFRVTASAEFEYNLTLDGNLSLLSPKCGKRDILAYSYEVPATRESAPRLKEQGYLVFIGRLSSPFIASSERHDPATLDDPSEVYERDLDVFFQPTEITIVGPQGDRVWTCALTPVATDDSGAPRPSGTASQTATGGGTQTWLQVASGTDRAMLISEFHQLSTANPELLRGITGYVVEGADRLRLVVGPFRAPADAHLFAEDLRMVGIDTFSWRPSGTEKLTAIPN